MTIPRMNGHKPQERNRNTSVELVINRDRRNADMLCALRKVRSHITDLSLVDEETLKRLGETGRQSRAPLVPFMIEHDMLCGFTRAAARSGKPAVQAAVREEVRAYFEKRCADVLSELPAESETDIVTAYLAETESQCLAEPHQATSAVRPDCVVSVERAVEHSRSYRRKLDLFIAAGERHASNLRRRLIGRPAHVRIWT